MKTLLGWIAATVAALAAAGAFAADSSWTAAPESRVRLVSGVDATGVDGAAPMGLEIVLKDGSSYEGNLVKDAEAFKAKAQLLAAKDKIEKDSTWVAAFRGVPSPILGVKRGQGTGAEGEVEMITGATISSRAIIDIINHRLEDLGEVLRTFEAGRAASTEQSTAEPTASREGGR